MVFLLEELSAIVEEAFAAAGYEGGYGKVLKSSRPDLCEFQCNGAMSAAKAAHRNPLEIADDVGERLRDSAVFSEVAVVKPGFLNLRLEGEFLLSRLSLMAGDEDLGLVKPDGKQKVMVDYGGPNVAKPLHIGHLRAAIIGESVKRLGKALGHEMTGDIHMGDWGLQMGLIIAELKRRNPSLPYFLEGVRDYPSDAPFTLSELEEIYPTASARSKEDEDFKAEAMEATKALQQGHEGYRAIWRQIMDISVADLKKNYDRLNVSFELWKGESDADPYIAPLVQRLKDEGYAHESQGALVVDIAEEGDTKEIPPCMILKSDGAALYTTTDLATLVERVQDFNPDRIIYVVDKRQSLHFTQVFRTAKKTGIVPDGTRLDFLGFGTMNGKGGKPFKTREGGIMRLSDLIDDVVSEMYRKIRDNESLSLSEAEAKEIAEMVAVSAIKYGDLSNQAAKDYIFDIDKFTSFEGNTGPYILYTMVRIKSIIRKYKEKFGSVDGCVFHGVNSGDEKSLMLLLAAFDQVISEAFENLAPHRVCAYIYELANAFNHFYHETKIIAEEDREKREGWIALLLLTLKVLEKSIDILGMEAPERM